MLRPAELSRFPAHEDTASRITAGVTLTATAQGQENLGEAPQRHQAGDSRQVRAQRSA